MVWTVSKDLSLLRAIAAEGIFVDAKAGSRERGAAWLNVAPALVAESLTVTVQQQQQQQQQQQLYLHPKLKLQLQYKE